MEPDGYVCSCGRTFPGPGPLNFHKRSCRPSKKRLHGALARAKELWQDRKRLRLDSKTSEELGPSQRTEIQTDQDCDTTEFAYIIERSKPLETVRSPSFLYIYIWPSILIISVRRSPTGSTSCTWSWHSTYSSFGIFQYRQWKMFRYPWRMRIQVSQNVDHEEWIVGCRNGSEM